MSDEETDNKQQQGQTEAALDIEVVSVEVAEQEAAQARAEAEQKVEQQLAEQMSEVLNKVESEAVLEDEAEQAVETPVKVATPQQPSLQAKVEKVSEDDDEVLFDNQVDYLEEAAPVAEKKPPEASNIEGLTEIVLDAASAANEAAHSTNQSIHMLLGSVTTINNMAKGLRRSNNFLLMIIFALGLVGLISGAAMLFVLQSSVKDATSVSLAMGAKLVQFEQQMDRVTLLETQLIDVSDVNHQLGQSVEQMMFYLRQVGTDSQQAASQQAQVNEQMLGSVNDRILASFNGLQNTSKAQQSVLKQLKTRIDSLQSQMKSIQNEDLVGKVKALVALEQERYYDLEKEKLAQDAANRKEDAPSEETFITFGVKATQ
ncbi:MAG TPA: hypothetical protein DCW89_00680 [Oceanospirillaceae bacterium]|nr:hypothetical protein [Oceanospirillaceae bacterium]